MGKLVSLRALLFTGLTAGCFLSGSAFSATDGDLALGTVGSQGTVDINVTVNPVIQISGLTDINFSFDASAGNPAVGVVDFCVYTNAATGLYEVLALSSGGSSNGESGTNFLLTNTNDVGIKLIYNVGLNDTGSTAVDLTNNNIEGGFTANGNTTDCSGGASTSLTVSVTKDDAVAVPAGIYSDTLTLTVSPT